MQVNAFTLRLKISDLENERLLRFELSLKEEYQLEAYKMLLAYLLHDGAEDYSGQYARDWDTK